MKANHNGQAVNDKNIIVVLYNTKILKMKANHNTMPSNTAQQPSCSLQHKDTKNESKSQLPSFVPYLQTCCSLQHKDTKNESKSQLTETRELNEQVLFFTTQRY